MNPNVDERVGTMPKADNKTKFPTFLFFIWNRAIRIILYILSIKKKDL